MIATGKLDVTANRGTPFVLAVDFPGYDFSAATLQAQLREYPDAPAVLVELQNAAANAQGVSVAVAPIGGIMTSTVTLRINEVTLEGLLPPGAGVLASGSDVRLFWGLHITSTGLGKVRWIDGSFTIRAGDQG